MILGSFWDRLRKHLGRVSVGTLAKPAWAWAGGLAYRSNSGPPPLLGRAVPGAIKRQSPSRHPTTQAEWEKTKLGNERFDCSMYFCQGRLPTVLLGSRRLIGYIYRFTGLAIYRIRTGSNREGRLIG